MIRENRGMLRFLQVYIMGKIGGNLWSVIYFGADLLDIMCFNL